MKRKLLLECLAEAIKLNPKHNQPYRHFSFIIVENKIVSCGMNRSGPPIARLGYPDYAKQHSEFVAFQKAYSVGETLVNIRLTKRNRLRNSMPCQCCLNFLKSLGVREVWFSTDLETFAKMEI